VARDLGTKWGWGVAQGAGQDLQADIRRSAEHVGAE